MYKLMLVDDESDIREGLQEVIDFEKYGFTVVGEASNGVEALQVAEREQPDLIVSDIRMPLMDGLTMLKKARQTLPTLRCIILSGYDDFEYARQAMKVNCLGYLLKPISSTEFAEVLEGARRKLDEEFSQRLDLTRLQKHFADSLPLLREGLWTGLLAGGVSPERAHLLAARYDTRLDAAQYVVALSRLEAGSGSKTAPELADLAAVEIAQEQLSAHGQVQVFHYQEWLASVVMLEDGSDDAFSAALEWLDEARRCVDYYLGVRSLVGVGAPCRNLEGLAACAKQALSALEQCALWEDQPLLCAADLEPGTLCALPVNGVALRSLCNAIKQSNTAETGQALDRLMESCTQAHPSRTAYRAYLLEVYASLMHTARDMAVDIASRAAEALDKLVACPAPEEARELLWRMCCDCAEGIRENRATSSRVIARAAEEYISENYADPKLSMEKLCSHLHVSPSYFAALFKKETQQTFLQRLTDVRMTKAMSLIAGTDMKTAQVAEAVGIPDPSYFSYAFKRFFGVSPSQARRQKGGSA